MKVFRNSILTLAATSLLTTAAYAGGFSTEGVNPGGAIFNDKSLVIQGALGYVMPQREYKNGSGTPDGATPATTPGVILSGATGSTNASDNYFLLSGDLKFKVNDEIDCAIRAHKPYSLDTNVADNFTGVFYVESLEIDSLGIDGTCSYKFAVSEDARLRILAGVTSTDLTVVRDNYLAAGPTMLNRFDVESDRGFGFRIGGSFEIPKYALRAQIIYDSAIDLDLEGTRSVDGTGAVVATSSVEMPQSVSGRVQTGVNETTLVYAGFRWMEWSSLAKLGISFGGVSADLDPGYNDGWTVEAGVQKKLTDDLSGTLSITWNEGIGDGYEDTWKFGSGLAYDLDDNWRVSLGASATLLTSGSQSSASNLSGATSNYTYGNDWAYAIGTRLQYSIK